MPKPTQAALPTTVLLAALAAALYFGRDFINEPADPPHDAPTGPAVIPNTTADTVVNDGLSWTAASSDDIRFGVRTPPAKAKGAIRIATYNVENLFDDQDDPTLSGDIEDLDMRKPDAHLEAAADALRRLDADVVALEEVESEGAVRWFRDQWLEGLGYTHLASIDAGDGRGIEQAVLSRYPITHTENWPGRDLGGVHPDLWGSQRNYNAGEPLQFHRSPLRVDVEIPTADEADTYTLTLFVVHHKSGRYGDYWREAEAEGLVSIIDELEAADPQSNVVVLGDFNAMLRDFSVRIYLDAGLIDAFADERDMSDRYVTHESGRPIDLMLVNANLAHELVPKSGFVLGTPARPAGADWRTTPPPAGYASDHYPVAVDLLPNDR